MKCPVCKKDTLQAVTLDEGLPGYRCATCEGVWVRANDYLTWLSTTPALSTEQATDNTTLPTWDTRELNLCPDCARILTRYKVLPNVSFQLDRCKQCNGYWFDRQEWEGLVARNLHRQVNSFFTEPWQTHVKEEETASRLDGIYQAKFGADDYAKLKEVAAWMKEHPQRDMFLAFLQADDPYRI